MSVTVLDALTYAGSRESLRAVEDQIRMVEGDLTDEPLVDRLVAESDAVVHFAAETHVDNSLTDPAAFLRSNVIGTYWCSRRCASTGAPSHLHRRGLRRPATQRAGALHRRDAVQPVQPVLGHQGLADLLVRAWARSYGVRATISNCSNNYGPHQHVEKFIPRQITNLLTGRRPAVRRRGQRPGLDPRRRPQQRGVAHPRRWHHRPHLSDRRRRRTRQPLGAAADPAVDGPRPRRLRPRHRPRRPRPAVRDRLERVARRAGLGAEAHRLRRGSRRHHEWYRDNEWWWAPLKEQVEAGYAKRGQ